MVEREPQNSAVQPPEHSGTILLVDDEQLIRTSTKRLLERLGYRVILAEDGRDALDIYVENKDDVEVVVLDLMMPGMSGEEAFVELQKINADVRVILSSGYSRDEKAESLIDLGAVGFLEKPFDLDTLIEELLRAKGQPRA